jgi:hypothetical protein
MRRTANSSTLLAAICLLVGATLPGCGGSDSSSPPEHPPANELRSDKLRVTAPVVSTEDAATFANDNLAFSVDLHLALR